MPEPAPEHDPSPSLFQELRRRRVFRVGGAYVLVAWVLMQAGEIVFPAFDLPNSALRALILALAAGLPIVILLAWVLDVTPTGIRLSRRLGKLPRSDSGETGSHETGESGASADGTDSQVAKSLEMLLLGVFVPVFAFAVLVAVLKFGDADPAGVPAPRAVAIASGPSIAVLPFEDLSMQPGDSGFFARGMHEDILTQLTRVDELKVISRTSVMPYAGKQVDIRTIGAELGVAHILEGSVRRTPTQVRVTAQLIRVSSDEHLWAENFDAGLENVFEVQTRIATAIASALEAELVSSLQPGAIAGGTDPGSDPNAGPAPGVLPRKVLPAAYDAYLKARDLHRNLDAEDPQDLRRARHLYELALQTDPSLAEAWLQLGILHSQAYWFGIDRSPERPRLARKALDRAEALSVDRDQLALAEGILAYYVDSDFSRALLHFSEAARRAPGNAEAHFYRAMILRRVGELDEALAAQARARELDPLNFGYREEEALTLALAGRLEEARLENADLLLRDPDRIRARFQKWQLDLELDGDPARLLEEILATPRELWHEQHYTLLESVAVLAGRPEAAIEIFESRDLAGPDSGFLDYRLAVLEGFAGHPERREERLGRAEEKFKAFAARWSSVFPENDRRRIEASFAAQRDRWDEALRLQSQNVAALPIEQDLIVGSPPLWLQLHFELAANRPDAAIESLDRLGSRVALGGILYGGHFVLEYWPEFEAARKTPRLRAKLESIRPDYAKNWR